VDEERERGWPLGLEGTAGGPFAVCASDERRDDIVWERRARWMLAGKARRSLCSGMVSMAFGRQPCD
jgi:hypothetical protein